jgi:hypothetical protein
MYGGGVNASYIVLNEPCTGSATDGRWTSPGTVDPLCPADRSSVARGVAATLRRVQPTGGRAKLPPWGGARGALAQGG